MKKILVTGANGFLGSAVSKLFSDNGCDVLKGVRAASAISEISIDLKNPSDWIPKLKKMHFDSVVHLGAEIGWNSQAVKSDMYIANVLSTGFLAELAKDWGAHFIFASAAIVHGVHAPYINVASPIMLDSEYGENKYLAEKLIESSGCLNTILRIGGVYGYPGPLHLGINKSLFHAIQNNHSPALFGSGEVLRNYIYVNDLSQVIYSVFKNKIFGTHLVGGVQILSIRTMCELISKKFLKGLPLICRDGSGSDQIIETSLLLKSGRSFEEALNEIWLGIQ